ncbi:leucine zipper domain-containing protein [Streptomyces sp. NPDC007251]|uniref:leucine zipper domain-containing protein n=1 Tax=unclassified Streptomyces TaxID=2593676 RepID=UPI0033CF1651
MNAATESRSATSRGHRNAPLTFEGRLRLCLRIDVGRPTAHVAADAGIARRCLAKWYARRRAPGENGLLDHSSRPATSPARTPRTRRPVEALRRQAKRGPARLATGPTAAARRHTRARDRPPHPGEARTQPAPGPRPTDRRASVRGHLLRARPGRRSGPRRRQETRTRPDPAAAGSRTASAPSPPAPPKAPVPAPARSDTRTRIRRSTTTPGSPTPRPWTMRRSSPRSPSGTGPPYSSPTASHRSAAASIESRYRRGQPE